MQQETPSAGRLEVRLDNQLCFSVYSASHTIEKHYQTLLKAQGLTYTQYLVLMALAEEDGVSISTLAGRLGVSKATMTPLLRRLEEKGLLSREITQGNERQKSISLTETGRNIWIKSCNVSSDVFARIGLTQAEADELIRICTKITSTEK
ncbi:MarR family winged helix-turn-helix transcriptional regulator [Phaeobacter gallaeciensis]|uniref:Transcriptional regulator n=1 Tax=Phaeobacter gallaeciensis TaxID=60890 RepID=A0AAC9Z7T3_9RHOB|nr:MarR family transcriptional regulator [Phaeobacter gallaeciensis]AHD08890.1 Transcriptional regulator [Phaeobacter gallaeciensis DSM 26640]ATE92156.1 Transcriptional regulator [Phaeobacter gallaeciensis]ATE98025.1 Transcriptional regulator [Phaeobacter gallaeciensis]ATF00818.1 Transcriptional regulator [Phaeobacter gallaeciensis]ATF05198.1 Transcriptional regulator [Phaeobacter gallaeciensis]